MNGRIVLIIVLGALAAFGSSLWISEAVFHRAPITTDEQSYVLQAHLLSTGRIKHPPPPFIEPFRYPMVIVDPVAGWMSRYPPGHALWLMSGVWANNLYLMVGLAAALSVLLVGLAARRFGGSVAAALLLLLLSPYFLFTYGTLMSHVTGMVASSAMLLAYVLWRQQGSRLWAVCAGLAWSWLLLNRTYTALLMALPFAVDALWMLWKQRSRPALWETVLFAGSACIGVVAILYWRAIGHPLTMTYLFYDPTDQLGFGLRHHWPVFPAPDPVTHTLARGLTDLKRNMVLLDEWMLGFRGGLWIWLGLTVIGWSKRWSPLLLSLALVVPAGYVFFWYPGWNETGPNYYFEIYPAMVLTASLGVTALMRRIPVGRRVRVGLVGALLISWVLLARPFVEEQARYQQNQTYLRSEAIATMNNAPPKSLVFVRQEVTRRAWPNHDLVFSPTALEGDVIVARWLPSHNRALIEYFRDYRPMTIEYVGRRFILRSMKVESLDVPIPIRTLFRQTGTNIWDDEDPQLYVRMASDEHAAGFLAFGRYVALHPGRFRVEFDVRATDASSATVDLARDQGRITMASAPVPVSTEWQTVSLEFDCMDFPMVEPRMMYSGTGRAELSRIRIVEWPAGVQPEPPSSAPVD